MVIKKVYTCKKMNLYSSKHFYYEVGLHLNIN